MAGVTALLRELNLQLGIEVAFNKTRIATRATDGAQALSVSSPAVFGDAHWHQGRQRQGRQHKELHQPFFFFFFFFFLNSVLMTELLNHLNPQLTGLEIAFNKTRYAISRATEGAQAASVASPTTTRCPTTSASPPSPTPAAELSEFSESLNQFALNHFSHRERSARIVQSPRRVRVTLYR